MLVVFSTTPHLYISTFFITVILTEEGTYVKVWSGREDNEHLVEVMAKLDVKAEDYQDQLYHELAKRYALLDLT